MVLYPFTRVRLFEPLSLTDFFLTRFSERSGKQKLQISKDAQQKLDHYFWPGNVRELENTIERALILSREDELQSDDILLEESGSELSHDSSELINLTLKEIEERHIKLVLEDCSWHLTKTAKRLKIGYNTLWRRMKEYGISK